MLPACAQLVADLLHAGRPGEGLEDDKENRIHQVGFLYLTWNPQRTKKTLCLFALSVRCPEDTAMLSVQHTRSPQLRHQALTEGELWGLLLPVDTMSKPGCTIVVPQSLPFLVRQELIIPITHYHQ
jgi:hypothetical protein